MFHLLLFLYSGCFLVDFTLAALCSTLGCVCHDLPGFFFSLFCSPVTSTSFCLSFPFLLYIVSALLWVYSSPTLVLFCHSFFSIFKAVFLLLLLMQTQSQPKPIMMTVRICAGISHIAKVLAAPTAITVVVNHVDNNKIGNTNGCRDLQM